MTDLHNRWQTKMNAIQYAADDPKRVPPKQQSLASL
jgi:hypothetical protein